MHVAEFTVAEASWVTGLSVKAVNKAIEDAAVPVRIVRGGGVRRRFVPYASLLCLQLHAEGLKRLPLRMRREVFRRVLSEPQVERGFLLGCARKYSTLLNNKSNELIVSFSYFQNVIAEAGELQTSEDYWRYLQLRLHQMEWQWIEQTQASGEGKFNKRLMAPMSGRI